MDTWDAVWLTCAHRAMNLTRIRTMNKWTVVVHSLATRRARYHRKIFTHVLTDEQILSDKRREVSVPVSIFSFISYVFDSGRIVYIKLYKFSFVFNIQRYVVFFSFFYVNGMVWCAMHNAHDMLGRTNQISICDWSASAFVARSWKAFLSFTAIVHFVWNNATIY